MPCKSRSASRRVVCSNDRLISQRSLPKARCAYHTHARTCTHIACQPTYAHMAMALPCTCASQSPFPFLCVLEHRGSRKSCVLHGLSLTCVLHGLSLTCVCVCHKLSLTCVLHGLSLTCVPHGLSLTCVLHKLSLTCVLHRLSLTCVLHELSLSWGVALLPVQSDPLLHLHLLPLLP